MRIRLKVGRSCGLSLQHEAMRSTKRLIVSGDSSTGSPSGITGLYNSSSLFGIVITRLYISKNYFVLKKIKFQHHNYIMHKKFCNTFHNISDFIFLLIVSH